MYQYLLIECAGIKDEKVKEFADNVYENFEEFKPITDILEKDYSVRILQMLRKSTGLVKEFLSAIVVVSPDSMTVERCFSTFDILFSKGRTSTSQSTLFERLIIYWNGVPTARYDPRQAVSRFFCDKKRRESRP